jgi:hypothetical protein
MRTLVSAHEQQLIDQAALAGDTSTRATADRFRSLLFKPLSHDDELPAVLSSESERFPLPRSLLICNLPPHYDRDTVEEAFGVAGPIERIVLAETSASSQIAVVVFRRADALARCAAMHVEPAFAAAVAADAPRDRSARWADEFWAQRPPLAPWRAALDRRMQRYDRAVERRRSSAVAEASNVDADGFTVVQAKRRHTVGKTSVRGVRAVGARKTGAGVERDFYAFQVRRQRDDAVQRLQRQLNDAKERLARLRNNRKFLPAK